MGDYNPDLWEAVPFVELPFPIQDMHVIDGRLFVAAGPNLYEIHALGDFTNHGVLDDRQLADAAFLRDLGIAPLE